MGISFFSKPKTLYDIDPEHVIYGNDMTNMRDVLAKRSKQNNKFHYMVSNIEQRQYTLNSFETYKDIYMYTTHAVQFSCDQIYNLRCTNKEVLLLVKINHSMYHIDSAIASFHSDTLYMDKKSMDVKSWEQHYVHDTARVHTPWFLSLSPNHPNVHNIQLMFCTKNTSIRTFDILYEGRMFCNEARNIIHDPKCYGYVNHDYRLHRGTLHDYLQVKLPGPCDTYTSFPVSFQLHNHAA
jgi:hypothetical protein